VSGILSEVDHVIKFEYLEKQSEILRRVAGAYTAGSDEESAIRIATLALLFVVMNHDEGFKDFLQDNEKELTAKQRDELAALGLK
jgi:metal-responsive CopG/Arc/MetJ family transcriptional regulator